MHLGNLVEPDDIISVRKPNQEHITHLKKELKSGNMYTVLVGYTDDPTISLEKLATPGTGKIQVLGGNHTRLALQEILTEDPLFKLQTVFVDIYVGLTEEESLRIGVYHNQIHDSARKITFEEEVRLFRKLLFRTRELHPEDHPKTQSSHWRTTIGNLLQLPVRIFF